MPKLILRLLGFFCSLYIFSTAATEIPKALEEWKPWVLEKHPDLNCPFEIQNEKSMRHCLWQSNLLINASNSGASFRQTIQVYKNDWIALPGNSAYWPQQVADNAQPISVREHNQVPEVFLTLGTHEMSGEFHWSELPHTLQIPETASLIQLQVNGKPIESPTIENQNQLWLSTTTTKTATTHQDTFELRVYRKITDTIPLKITTQLQMDVSGKERELHIGQLLLNGFTPSEFISSLPAHIEKDGSLRIQVKPGSWELTLVSQSNTPLHEMTFAKLSDDWPDEELWAFEAQPQLRQTQITGVQTLDPEQTEMPDDWKIFPSYLVTPTTPFKIDEVQRGENADMHNTLSIKKAMWLTFDADRFIVEDNITGSLNNGHRLDTVSGVELTRASVDDQAQLITHLPNTTASGVEVRTKNIDVTAVSQIEKQFTLPISGWNRDVDSVSMNLHLPVGWSLLAATNTQIESGTWLSKWSLIDIILISITAFLIGRCTNTYLGLLTATTLTLIAQRDGIPLLIWITSAMLIFIIPYAHNKIKKYAQWAARISLVFLTAYLLPFLYQELKAAIYPENTIWNTYFKESQSLNWLDNFLDEYTGVSKQKSARALAPPDFVPPPSIDFVPDSPMATTASISSINSDDIGSDTTEEKKTLKEFMMDAKPAAPVRKILNRKYDPNQKTQSGLAVPDWKLNNIYLSWSGSIKTTDKTTLFLIPPIINRLGDLLSAIASVYLAWIFLMIYLKRIDQLSFKFSRFYHRDITGIVLVALVASASLVTSKPADADVNIDANLLSQLEARLTKPPQCIPHCMAIESASLTANDDQVSLELIIHSEDHLAFALPSQRDQWHPDQVKVDGKNATVTQTKNNHLLVELSKGRHTLVMKGTAQGQYTVNLDFALPLHNVTTQTKGWEVVGAPTKEQASQSLQLQRVEKDTNNTADRIQPDAIPTFVSVKRELQFGLKWGVHTTVSRVAPITGAINIDIPLLESEAPLTTQINSNGKIGVHLESNQQETDWYSSLEQKSPIILHATANAPWNEIWSVDASSLWHVTTTGLTPITQDGDDKISVWQPWPDETLHVEIAKPEPTEGAHTTIDLVHFTYSPHERLSESHLVFDIRTYQGGSYAFQLPEKVKLKSIHIDNVEQRITPSNAVIHLPLKPGKQSIDIEWTSDDSLSFFTATPQFDLTPNSSNQHLTMNLTSDRWILFAGGPQFGPSVLFWPVCLGTIIFTLLFSQWIKTPLRQRDWILLSIGICTLHFALILLITFCMLALRQRGKLEHISSLIKFKLSQLGLISVSVACLAILAYTVISGLTNTPSMNIEGNGSDVNSLMWYKDYSTNGFPHAWVISLPVWCYKLAILLWALWLTTSITPWLRWGWQQLNVVALWTTPKKAVGDSSVDAT